MIGEGIKKIPAYKCLMPFDKLHELREKFWDSKQHYKRVWKVIRECCETDAETAVMLLEAAEMACVKNDLREVIVLTNPETVFRVPNYCVCDPVYEVDYNMMKEKYSGAEQVKIKIVLYYVAKNKNVKLHVTNKTKIKKVKEAFAKNMGIDLTKFKIRLFFKGQELLDDNLLCYNGVEDMSKIQVMVNEL